MTPEKKKLHPALAALIVVALIGIVASAAIIINHEQAEKTVSQDTSTVTTSTQDTPLSQQTDSTDTSTYKDGTYEATGVYLSPGGRESIALTVTIKDGIITDTTLSTDASDREAREYQTMFANNYKSVVVGKSINGLKLTRVAGASLTTNGFNDALETIRSDAKA